LNAGKKTSNQEAFFSRIDSQNATSGIQYEIMITGESQAVIRFLDNYYEECITKAIRNSGVPAETGNSQEAEYSDTILN